MSMLPFEQSPTDRWKVVTHPPALPGECFLCRGVSLGRDWFVDLMLDFEFHGRVYLCNECLSEIAEIVGYLTPDHATQLKDRVASLEEENYRLQAEVAAFHEMEKAIGVFVDRGNVRSVSDSPGSGGIGSDGLAPDDSTEESSGGADRLGEGEGATPEPQHDEGMDVVHADDGGNADFSLNL